MRNRKLNMVSNIRPLIVWICIWKKKKNRLSPNKKDTQKGMKQVVKRNSSNTQDKPFQKKTSNLLAWWIIYRDKFLSILKWQKYNFVHVSLALSISLIFARWKAGKNHYKNIKEKTNLLFVPPWFPAIIAFHPYTTFIHKPAGPIIKILNRPVHEAMITSESEESFNSRGKKWRQTDMFPLVTLESEESFSSQGGKKKDRLSCLLNHGNIRLWIKFSLEKKTEAY